MVRVERHGLLLIHIFARLNGRHEVKRVLVLRRGDENRVNRLVIEQPPKITVSLEPRGESLRLVQPAGIDIRDCHGLYVRTAQGGPKDLLSPAARANQADADALIGAEDAPRRDDARQG